MKRALLRTTLLLTILLLFTSCKEQIVHDLSEVEANKIALRLHEHLINSEKIRQPDGNWAISVLRENALQAIKVLDESRHFRRTSLPEQPGGSVISSREDQRFHFERNLSREIENTLRSIESVFDVRVHLNLPAVDPLFGRPLRGSEGGSASVLLVVSNASEISRQDIASLVSGASGVAIKDVSVLLHQSIDVKKAEFPVTNVAARDAHHFISKVFPAQFLRGSSKQTVLSIIAFTFVVTGLLLLWRGARKNKGVVMPVLSGFPR